MSPTHDPEQLMMDALEGTLSESDRQALQVYFGKHPEERAFLERMQKMERSLRAEPVAAVPFVMTRNVMDAVAVARTHVSKPAIKGPQIVFVIGIAGIITLLVAVLILAFVMQLSPLAPDAAAEATLAFLRGAAGVVQSIFLAMIAFIRAAFSQPLTWLISLGMVVIVIVWLRVMLAVLAPSLRIAAA